jgi:acetylornithine deacetylase
MRHRDDDSMVEKKEYRADEHGARQRPWASGNAGNQGKTSMLDDSLAARLRDAVDANFEEQIAFTADLVRFPSLRGQEHTAQDFMAGAFRDEGLDVDRWQVRIEDIEHLPGFSPVTISYDNAFNVVGSHLIRDDGSAPHRAAV